MKNSFLLLLIIFSLFTSCNGKNSKTPNTNTSEKFIDKNEITFEWKSFELNGKKYEHGAMFLPIHLDSVKKEFKMQFDLGLNVSGIYEESLKTILSKNPYLKSKIRIGKDYEVLKVKTKIGNYSSSLDSLFIFKDYGEDKTYNELELIGSIGANEIENKILIIDFKNTSLKILENTKLFDKEKFNFVPLEYKYGKIFIPLSIGGKIYNYIYDTGASITPITTIDKSFFSKATSISVKLDTIKMNSWGKLATFIKTEIKVPIQLGKINIETKNKSIFYTEEEKIIETLEQVNVKGLIGNDFFIDDIIVIDLINNKFGIKKK